MEKISLRGNIKQGLRIASGLNPDRSLKLNNTIAQQKPFFIKAGIPDMESMHNGTINLFIAPATFKITKPHYEVTCEWFKGVTETFHLVKADIEYNNAIYQGYVYYPCPSAVKNHDDNIVELLAPKIVGVKYGDPITAHVAAQNITLA